MAGWDSKREAAAYAFNKANVSVNIRVSGSERERDAREEVMRGRPREESETWGSKGD